MQDNRIDAAVIHRTAVMHHSSTDAKAMHRSRTNVEMMHCKSRGPTSTVLPLAIPQLFVAACCAFVLTITGSLHILPADVVGGVVDLINHSRIQLLEVLSTYKTYSGISFEVHNKHPPLPGCPVQEPEPVDRQDCRKHP